MAKTEYVLLLLIFSCLIPGTLAGFAKAEKLDINTATNMELTSLPYIGPIRARTIIACRNTHGPFKDFEDLLACDGIGPDTLKIMQAELRLSGNQAQSPRDPEQERSRKTAAKAETAPGNVLLLENAAYFPALLNKIRGAETNIDLAMFVFKTTKSSKNRPSMIIKELISAAQWGVKVRVFLEKSGYDDKLNETNQLTAKQLRDNGIKVIFDSPNVTTHTKLVVIDRRYSFVGSHNFTNAALKYNNEVSLLVDDQKLAHKLTDYMEGITSR